MLEKQIEQRVITIRIVVRDAENSPFHPVLDSFNIDHYLYLNLHSLITLIREGISDTTRTQYVYLKDQLLTISIMENLNARETN